MNVKTEYALEKIYSFCLLVSTLWLLSVGTSVQHSMTKGSDHAKRLKKATFSDFKRAFLAAKWVFDERYPSSLFGEPYGSSYYHASIIAFNGTGYLLTTYGLIRAQLFVRAYISKNYKRKIIF